MAVCEEALYERLMLCADAALVVVVDVEVVLSVLWVESAGEARADPCGEVTMCGDKEGEGTEED